MLLYSILGVLGALLFLLLLLLLLPLTVGVDWQYEDKKQICKLRLRLLGIPITVRMPLDKEEKKAEQAAEKDIKKAEKTLTPKRFVALAKNLHRLYGEAQPEVKNLLTELRKRVACNEIFFIIRYGTVNPARTGLLNGAVWTGGTLILRVLDAALGVRKKTLEVYPDFQRAFMCLHMKISFCFRPVSMLRIGIKTLKLIKNIRQKLTEEI